MTSRRVPVPNPKFARSASSDFDEKDDDDDTKRATLTKGVSKQQAKIKDTNSKRASKKTSSSVDEATKKNGPSGKKDAEKQQEPKLGVPIVVTKQFAVLSLDQNSAGESENRTRILEFSGRLTEIDYGNSQDGEASFNVKESTISCQKISDDEVLQATDSELIVLKLDFETWSWKRVRKKVKQ